MTVSEGRQWDGTGRYWQVLGILLFVLSYFLPACRGNGGKGAGSDISNYLGYQCVLPSLWFLGMFLTVPFGGKLSWSLGSALARIGYLFGLSFGGVLNIAVPVYLLATLPTMRRSGKLAIAVIVSALLALSALLLMHFTPLVGFYLRVAGALLILMPEFRGSSQSPANSDPSARSDS